MMLDRMEGNAELKTSVHQMLASRRLTHSVLLVGEEGLGAGFAARCIAADYLYPAGGAPAEALLRGECCRAVGKAGKRDSGQIETGIVREAISVEGTYARLYNTGWWNEETQNYYAYKLENENLKEGGCNVFPLWFGIVDKPERINRLLAILSEKETNVESMSYYPKIFYKYGRQDMGYHYLKELYANERRDYPEVASGVIEGIVCGLAGVDADVTANRITTLPRFTDATRWISIENIPVFSGKISILHQSAGSSTFANKSGKELIWRAMFPGNVAMISGMDAKHTNDELGNSFSYLDIVCKPGETKTAEACKYKLEEDEKFD
mgnify:CR=1 FL=1